MITINEDGTVVEFLLHAACHYVPESYEVESVDEAKRLAESLEDWGSAAPVAISVDRKVVLVKSMFSDEWHLPNGSSEDQIAIETWVRFDD